MTYKYDEIFKNRNAPLPSKLYSISLIICAYSSRSGKLPKCSQIKKRYFPNWQLQIGPDHRFQSLKLE